MNAVQYRLFKWTSVAVLFAVLLCAANVQPSDPLPSWNAGPHKQAIVDFVTKVTRQETSDYIPPNTIRRSA